VVDDVGIIAKRHGPNSSFHETHIYFFNEVGWGKTNTVNIDL
jgi:hypothetical protein